MARPIHKGIAYFPLDCHPNDKLRYIEAKHGLEGYAIVIKLWTKVYASEGYYSHWDERTKFLFSRENGIDPDLCERVLNTCLEESLFDPEILQKYGVLTSVGIQKRYFKIVKEAKRKSIQIWGKIYLLGSDSGVTQEETRVNTGLTQEETRVNSGVTPVESTQSKVKKSKVNKSKEKGTKKESAPSKNNDENFDKENESELSESPSGSEEEKEKSSAKKEKEVSTKTEPISEEVLKLCQERFEWESPIYVWESNDDEYLAELLGKLQHGFGANAPPDDKQLTDAFQTLLEKMPKYWKEKKFTIKLINWNYNEIVNEIIRNKPKTKKRGAFANDSEREDWIKNFGK